MNRLHFETREVNKKIFLVFLLIMLFYGLHNKLTAAHLEGIFLTHKEQIWLGNRQASLKVGITHIPNQVLRHKNGTYTGLAIDFYRELEILLNIKFDWVYFDTWSELIEAGKDKRVDIVFSAQKTPERLAYFYFTDPFLTQQNKIIAQSNKDKQMDVKGLSGVKTAVAKGSALYEYLHISNPSIDLLAVNTELGALKKVLNGEAKAAISEAVRAGHYIKEHNLQGLRIVGDVDYDYQLRIASRNDQPVLNIILSKALDKISQHKRHALYLKWGYVTEKVSYLSQQTLIYIEILMGVLIPFLLIMFFVNQRLKKEVVKRIKIETLLTSSIAKLKQQENGLKEAKLTAENANQAKDKFLANMSHEIRTPMSAIIAIGHLMHETKLSAQQHDYISIMKNASKTLLGTIDNILDFSKGRAGKLVLETVIFNLDNLLQEVQQVLATTAKQKNVPLNVRMDLSKPIFLKGDPHKLIQILTNLGANALKFTEQGQVEIAVKPVKILADQITLRFTVTDTGIGISQAQQQQLFKPFFQADSSITRHYGGTGLGLIICQQLVDLMSGKIILESQLGKGSCFSFMLKFSIVEGVSQTPEKSGVEKTRRIQLIPALQQSKVLVLLVEDDETTQFFTKIYLKAFGVSVETAANGKEALQMLKQKSFDMVLMDLQMPEMDGYETISTIRQQKKWKNLPVIALTANALPN
ncbi:MAG: transporter substrate-binding domain-containing protein, partial [Cocleimonas sp.]|nr:transporter substrate-binding domain-containing protein [Cocleimonas sp.]